MKNKWLVAFLSVLMAVSLCFGVVACKKDKGNDDDNDLENVSYMIDSLNDMYADESELTPVTYTVTHSILVSGKQQPVEWSVEAVTEGITLSDFVVVGATDEAKNETTIEIKQTSQVVDYKLTATVTIGKESDSVSYDRQIPLIYSVAGIEEFGKDIASGSYYEVDGVKTPVIVSGYVVARGTFATDYKNWNDVYIADTADAAAEYPAAMQVYRLEVDGTVLKEDGDLMVGAKVLVHGWLQNYNGKLQLTHDASSSTGKAGNNPTAIQITPPELTDQEKVDLAKGMLTLPKTVYGKAGESVDLETSIAGAAVTWAVTSGEGATITGSTLKIASPLPSTPQEVVLTATIKAGAVTDTKTFTIQVGLSRTAPSTQENPYSVAEAQEFATTIANLDYSGRVFVKGYVVNKGSFSSNTWTNVYIADEEGESDTTKHFQVFKMSTNDILTQESELVVGDQVILSGFIQNFNGTYELTYNNQASDGDKNTYCVWTDNENAGQGGGSTEIQDGFTPMEQPTEGEFYYAAVKGSERLYVSDNTQLDSGTQGYLKTTNDPAQAVKLKLEKKADSETDWYIKMGEKYLEVLPYQSSGKNYTSYKLQLVASPTAVWTWLADARCFQQMVTPIAEKDKTPIGIYVGTYNSSNYTTLSPSTVSRITGDKVGDLDVSQHPARFGTIAEHEITDQEREAAIDAELAKVTGVSIEMPEDKDLPTSGNTNITFSWALKQAEGNTFPEGIALATDKITVTALPEEEKTVTLVLTATYKESEVSKDKEVTVTISAAHSSDEEKAQAALDSLDYESFKGAVYTETNAAGVQLPATSTTVTTYEASVVWSVEGEPNSYVSITENKLVISALPTEADETITLKVTVSVNGASKTDTITITLKKLTNYGTEVAPISVEEALKIAEAECPGSNEWTKKAIYVTGKVKGTPTSPSSKVWTFTLVDLKNDQKSIEIFKMDEHSTLPVPAENDTVVIYGWIENYYGSKLQFTGYTNGGKPNPVLVARTAGQSTITLGTHDGADVTGFESGTTVTKTNDETFEFTVTAQDGRKIDSVSAYGTTLKAAETETGKYSFTVKGNTTVTVVTSKTDAPDPVEIAKLGFSATEHASDPNETSYTGTWKATRNGITWTMVNFNNNAWNNSWTYIKAGRKSGHASTATITVQMEEQITEVVVNLDKKCQSYMADKVNAFKLQICDDNSFSGETLKEVSVSIATGDNSFVIPEAAQGTGKYYRIVVDCQAGNDNGFVVLNSVTYKGYE